jgi:archaemetzincin
MVRLLPRRAPSMQICFPTLLVSIAWATVLQVSEMIGRFNPFTPAQRLAAIGSTRALPEQLRKALEPGESFQPVPQPRPNDWLANHPERGQTFEQFVRSRPNRPDQHRNKLYLQPLGTFDESLAPSLDLLRRFTTAFFMMDVRLLPPLDLGRSHITSRRNPGTGQVQLLTGDILNLLKARLPDNAFALLGITMVDLYPDPHWNFVFGQASLQDRVGVYSFARYTPQFPGEADTAESRRLMLRRSCKVLAHETAHMFGIEHCIWYRCLMNGSNHLAESDARPLHLCSVDLHKLQWSIGFDVVERYRRVRDFDSQAGFEDEAKWLDKRIGFITRTAIGDGH